ncbi:uncharacterized protein A4U43_C03F29920 [Asparagus officinalis]|uniref:Uncharacterized protein n=1 Tax=Asparagus officinalis TaxID=4686 RepID=A0A5P1FFV3_ASPOF|nr:uncharacterized protein A4U43_C03F29920 [Asparagus officinalis]
MNANTAPFATRFGEACNYYGSVLDSLDAVMSREDRSRFRIECALGRKASNSIACEGADRVERAEVFGKWRARMSMAGFRPVQFGSDAVEAVKVRFGSMKANPGFTLEEDAGRVGFGWMGRVLTVASAWR